MKRKHFFLQIFYSLLITAGLPLIFALLLNTLNGQLIPVLVLALCAQVLASGRIYARGVFKSVFAVLQAALYAAGAIIILIYVILIPFPLYLAWTSLVRTGAPAGSISLLFVTGIAYFSALFAGLMFTSGLLRPLAALAAVVLFLVTVIYREMYLCLLTLFLFLGNAVLIVVYQWKGVPRVFHTLILPVTAGLVLALLFSVIDADKTGFLSYYTLSPQVRTMLESAFPAASALSLAPGYDDAEDVNRLGGRAFISKQPVCAVQAAPGQILYLRMKVFDEYTGANWKITPALIDKTRTGYENYMQTAPDEQGISITLLLDYSLLIPHTLNTRIFTIAEKQPALFAYGSKNTGFQRKLPVVKQTVIRLYEEPVLSALPVAAEEENILAFFRQLPGSIPDTLKALAAGFTAESSSVDSLANHILRYLENNCRYTLEAGYPPEGTDFTADFLFTTKKGYCVHFATAAAVLFRLCGIPSRYVKGYFVRIPAGQDNVICTGLSYHAWTEIYIQGKGWQIIEATPPLNYTPVSGSGYFARFNPGNDPLQSLQLIYLSSGKISVKPAGNRQPLFYIFLIVSIFCVLSGSLFLLYRIIRRRSGNGIRYKGYKKQISSVLVKLVKHTAGYGIPHPHTIGWTAWFTAWQPWCRVKQIYMHRALSIILKVLFSAGQVSSLDLKYLMSFYRRSRKTRNRFKYLLLLITG